MANASLLSWLVLLVGGMLAVGHALGSFYRRAAIMATAVAVALVCVVQSAAWPPGKPLALFAGLLVFIELVVEPLVRRLAVMLTARARPALAVRLLRTVAAWWGDSRVLTVELAAHRMAQRLATLGADELIREMQAGAPPAAASATQAAATLLYIAYGKWQAAIDHDRQAFGELTPRVSSLAISSDAATAETMPLQHARSPNYLAELAVAHAMLGDGVMARQLFDWAKALAAEGTPSTATTTALYRSQAAVLAAMGDTTRFDAQKRQAATWVGRGRWQALRFLALRRSGSQGQAANLANAPVPPAVTTERSRQWYANVVMASEIAVPADVRQRATANWPSLASLPTTASPKAWAPLALVVVTSLWFGWQLAVAGHNDPVALVRAGAVAPSLVADGQWWRLATGALAHAGVGHFVLNLVGLSVLAQLANRLFGTSSHPANAWTRHGGAWRTVGIVCLGCMAGTLAVVLDGRDGVALGASGGLFALLGAIVVELLVRRHAYAAPWRTRAVLLLSAATVFALVGDVVMLGSWPAAHGAGLVVGMAAGWWASMHHRGPRVAAVNAVSFALVTVAVCSLAAFGWLQLAGADATAQLRQRPTSIMQGAWGQIELPAAMRRAVPSSAFAATLGQTLSAQPLHTAGANLRAADFYDDDLQITLQLRVVSQAPSAALATWLSWQERQAASDGLALAFAPLTVAKPAGWPASAELTARRAIDAEGRSNGRCMVAFALPAAAPAPASTAAPAPAPAPASAPASAPAPATVSAPASASASAPDASVVGAIFATQWQCEHVAGVFDAWLQSLTFGEK